jgi:hypothetical protein
MSKNGEIVQEIVRGLNNIISTILKEKGILKPEDFTTNTDASLFSNKQVDSKQVESEQVQSEQVDDKKNTTVVSNTNSQDTIINVAPNEIIETQETYTVGEDGTIEIQGEPSKEKKYSL